MEFEEFTVLYPSLSREQVARVAGCSVALVNRWAMKGETGRDPGEDHKTRFDIAHWFWQNLVDEPAFFDELRRIRREAGL